MAPELIKIVTVLAGHQIGRQAGGSEKDGIAGDAEIIAEVQRDFEHGERPFDKRDIFRAILVHIILSIISRRRVKVRGRRCKVLPAEQQPAADIPVMSELVIRCQPDGAAWFISGHRIYGGEVGCDECADLQRPVDIQATFSLDRGGNGFCREGAQGGVRD